VSGVGAPRLGISIPLAGHSLAAHVALLERIEAAGFTDVWTQETDGPDAFTPLAFAAATPSRVRLGSAIASHFTRGPALLAMQAAALADAAPGRFVLGIGTSSRAMVSGWNGIAFERPLARTRDVLAFLRRAFTGERVDFAGETFAVRGFRLERPPADPPPIYLAALGPRMLELAAREADGLLLSLVSPEDVVQIRASLAAPAREIAMRIGVMVDIAPEEVRAHVRRVLAAYLTVDRYAALHRWLGRGDVLAPIAAAWHSSDRAGALAAVPDSLVDAIVVHGDVGACRRGLARFRAAGVTTPIVSLMRSAGDPLETLAELARPL
jgi:probable F420-dependent oxidoreductase